MTNRVAALLGTIALLTLPVAAAPPAPAKDARARIDAFVGQVFGLDLVPGLAMVVVKSRDRVYQRGLRYADREAGRRVTPGSTIPCVRSEEWAGSEDSSAPCPKRR